MYHYNDYIDTSVMSFSYLPCGNVSIVTSFCLKICHDAFKHITAQSIPARKGSSLFITKTE